MSKGRAGCCATEWKAASCLSRWTGSRLAHAALPRTTCQARRARPPSPCAWAPPNGPRPRTSGARGHRSKPASAVCMRCLSANRPGGGGGRCSASDGGLGGGGGVDGPPTTAPACRSSPMTPWPITHRLAAAGPDHAAHESHESPRPIACGGAALASASGAGSSSARGPRCAQSSVCAGGFSINAHSDGSASASGSLTSTPIAPRCGGGVDGPPTTAPAAATPLKALGG